MKQSPEFNRFDALVRRVMEVPRAEILRREEEYKKRAALNPHKRGPKSKKNDADHGPVDQPHT
ncbi:MAG: hypothetical protein M3N93_11815 [Acidobacteriota bacterium]|nr:hypothetical protein [Acidobacteriota bacterium]